MCNNLTAQSSDFNPTQYLWDELEHWLWARPDHPTSLLDLSIALVAECSQVSASGGKHETRIAEAVIVANFWNSSFGISYWNKIFEWLTLLYSACTLRLREDCNRFLCPSPMGVISASEEGANGFWVWSVYWCVQEIDGLGLINQCTCKARNKWMVAWMEGQDRKIESYQKEIKGSDTPWPTRVSTKLW